MLNEQQLKAVNQRDCNLLVSASAGSGKTKVLITRIANMILNKEANINNLLVVTFTKASASEMKERLINELSLIKDNVKDDELKENETLFALSSDEDDNVYLSLREYHGKET